MSENLTGDGRLSQGQLSIPSGQFPDPIPGIIPFGSFCLFVGPPKVGKTALYASWVPRWLKGQTICGKPTNRPTAIGVLTTDHKWALNQGPWFKAVGCPDVRYYSLRDDPQTIWSNIRTSPTTRTTLLKHALDKLALPPGGLVIIDVATVFITNKLNDYNEVVAGIGTMTQILDERELTSLGIGHMSKQRTDPKDRYLRAHERVSGSGAQVGYSDTIMYLLSPEDTGEAYHTFGWLPTHAAVGEFKFKQNPETGLFEPYTQADDHIAPDDPLMLVVDSFPEPPGALSAAEVLQRIEAACHIKEAAAKRRLDDLLLDGRIVRLRHGQYGRRQPS